MMILVFLLKVSQIYILVFTEMLRKRHFSPISQSLQHFREFSSFVSSLYGKVASGSVEHHSPSHPIHHPYPSPPPSPAYYADREPDLIAFILRSVDLH